jgi:hypothetical protein
MYNKSGASSSVIFRKKSPRRLPVGLLNARNPLGHSGHLRLHAVVGSMDTVNGIPQWMGFWKSRAM